MSEKSLIPPSKEYKLYVTGTDKFMSRWGPARNKINKLVFCCNSWEQAEIVEDNLKARSEMKHVNICLNKPSYDARRYYVQWFTPGGEYKNHYKKGYFRKMR